MKIAIVGAGAMGSRFGAMFYQSGHEVVLIDKWKEHIEQIHSRGLEVISEQGSTFLPINASLRASDVGEADLVLIFTKATQTEGAVRDSLPLIGEQTLIMTLQNGLGNVEVITEFIRKDQVIAGTTNFAAELMGPGVIQALGSGETHIMNVSGEVSEKLIHISEAMNKAGMNVTISPDVFKIIWTKVAFNSVMNPVTAITRLKVADLGAYEQREPFMRKVLQEIVQVASAEGISLDLEEILGTIRGVLDPKQSGEHLSSMLQDILTKRPTEVEHMNGAIVRLGERAGIPVPHNESLYHLIRMMETTYERRLEHL
ncbi:ketopantoate reductase family protein [Ammoniphilus sp. 3BR4]|uniref:ketopantoate reductase family protein n=1 Tax=Ammoniphilus sp. 3BR4 TaxID=3158265 RepID=UPI003467E362